MANGSYETVKIEREDGANAGITWVILNRPEKRNAMSPQLHFDMADVLNELESYARTKVLVQTIPLNWRRQRPSAVLLLVGAAFAAKTLLGINTSIAALGLLIAMYSVAAYGTTLQEAVARAYDGAARISFEGMHYRRDIARRGLQTMAQ